MDIKKLKLYNFRSHTDTEIVFDKDCYTIVGKIEGESKSNGSGKSSIPEAIAYALYGNADTGISNDSFIYNDEDKMFVELSFELNGKDYIIKRSVKRGSSPVLRMRINQDEFTPGLKLGQEMINDILGADFNIYRNTSYFKQGDLNSFSSLTPKEAKEVLISILQLDNYNKYEQLAKDMSKKVGEAIASLDADIAGKIVNIESIELDNNRVQYTQEDLDKLNNELKELNFNNKLKQDMFLRRDKEDKAIEERINIIDKERNEVGYSINANEKRLFKLEELSDTCPTCESKLNKEDIAKIIELINVERAPLIKKMEEFDKNLETIYIERQEILSIPIDETDYDAKILALGPQIGKIEAELNRAKQDESKLAKLKADLQSYTQEKEHKEVLKESYEKLQVAFGKKGIQAHIIDSVIPEIQATTNDILEGLETRIRVSLDSQKELKKGGKAETLDINIITAFGERPYANYSGGEKTLIDFALRIALSVILSRRSNCQIQTLILDEVFGELDAENKNIISRALTYIANKFDFKKIIIISHAEELQDSFNNIIKVVFDGTSSYIEKEKTDAKSEQYV